MKIPMMKKKEFSTNKIASWQIKVDQEKQQAEDLKKLEKKRLKLAKSDQLEKQKAELMNQSKSLQKSFSTTNPAQRESRGSSLDQQPNLTVDNRVLHEKASDLAAKQQRKNMDKLQKSVGDLTIGGIRALPGMTPAVEQFRTELQITAPSLAKTPTAKPSTGVAFQPAVVFFNTALQPVTSWRRLRQQLRLYGKYWEVCSGGT